jgi:hypothetical protein
MSNFSELLNKHSDFEWYEVDLRLLCRGCYWRHYFDYERNVDLKEMREQMAREHRMEAALAELPFSITDTNGEHV